MKKKNIILSVLLTLLLMLATACSDGDYLNAIPEGSTALLSINMAKAQDENGADKQRLLSHLLGVDNPKDCGIDLDAKLYLFESPDGSLGMAAKVSSADHLASMFNNMAGRSIATKVTEKRGFQFSVLRDSWVAGFSSKSLLVMGPVVGNAQAAMIQQVANYLSQDEEQGIKGTPMFEKLDSIGSSIALVAQAQALPEKFVAPFTLGAPKDADASQVLIAAKLSVAEGCLRINGETFSFNKRIDAALKEAAQVFRPIQGDYAESMGASSVMGVFMNVEGGGFLKLLQQNKGLMALLTGINAAIDMDNILRSVDGDMAITVPVFGEKFDITMAAKLAKTDFLKDVDYWKRSCPKGGRIVDTGTNRYCYTDGQTTFHFGVSADRQFFAGSTAEIAAAAIGKSAQPLPEVVRQQISGKRMAAVVSLSGIDNEVAQSVVQLLEPLFGKLHTMVYVVGG